jgi:hypothetical protein
VLLERFPVSAGLVAGLVLALTSVFALSLPMLRSPIDRTMLAKHAVPGPSLSDLRRAFARHDVPLATTPGLYVAAGRTRGPHTPYERRVGHLVVHYSGSDPRVLARVEAAVASVLAR